MSDGKRVIVKVTMDERYYNEIAGWARNLEPTATVEGVLGAAAMMLAMDEPTRERLRDTWTQAGLA